jgi:hypothetical protein
MAQNGVEFWSVMKSAINIQVQSYTAKFMINWEVITSEEGLRSTEIVDYLLSDNFIISAFCLF